MLKIVLPIRLPRARSTALHLNAPRDTINSGRDVDMAIKIFPTKVCPSPVMSAISAPILGKNIADPMTKIAFMIKNISALFNVISE